MFNLKQRKMRNFLLRPGTQIRYVILLSVWGVLGLSYIQGVLIHSMSGLAMEYASQLNVPGEYSSRLRDSIDNAWIVFGISVFFNCLMSVGFGILMSHRFLGPAHAIQGLVQELKEGRYSSRKNLRKGDELEELMVEVNQLAEQLEKKHGAG